MLREAEGTNVASAAFILSSVALVAIALLGLLLLGALRAVAVLHWRIDQLQATTPSRIGRNGLKPGRMAPNFRLPRATGGDVALEAYRGQRVLLVFTQS